MPAKSTLAQRVQVLLAAQDMSQTEADRKLGKRDFIGQLLRGKKSMMRDSHLQALAKILHTTPEYLLLGEMKAEVKSGTRQPTITGFGFLPQHLRRTRSAALEGGGTLAPAIGAAAVQLGALEAGETGEHDQELGPRLWAGQRRALPEITHLALSKTAPEHLSPSRPIRTAIPIFDLEPGSVGDLLDLKRLKWAPRPSELIGVSGVYGVKLVHDLGPLWKCGTSLIMAPDCEIQQGDMVLVVYEPGRTGTYLVEFRLFKAMMSITGVVLEALPGTEDLPRRHSRSPYRLHRIHSATFSRSL